MKKGELVVWRYHGELVPRFGIFKSAEMFHYNIKDFISGKIDRVPQSYVTILIDGIRYKKIGNLDKDRLYTKEEVYEICGLSENDDLSPYTTQSYINYQDITGV